MRLLHIITGLNTGGAERALCALLAGGLARRFDCAVLSLSDEGTMGAPIAALDVPVYTLGLRAGLPGLGAIWRLRNHLKSLRPDVIQGWMYHGNLAAILATCLAPGCPGLVWNIRQSLYDLGDEKPLTRQVIHANRLLSRQPSAVIYNSRLSREQHERFGISAGKGVVIPNGFDLSRLLPDSEVAAAMRRELQIGAEALVVGHVARFHPMKDHAGFLRAAVEVARRVPQARFLLVGREVSPDNPALAGIIPADLLSRFRFTGERQDVPRVIQSMDVLCSSSWSEAFPNVLGEAMACGVPCVATDVGDNAFIVGETGLVVPPSDSTALAKALSVMLEKSPGERISLGLEARSRVQENYRIDKVVDQYSKVYETFVGAKSYVRINSSN